MVDIAYLEFLENILTENRKERFLNVLKNRTRHFTVAVEDVFQMHNTSAVMRSCEVFGIQELNVIEQRFGKRIDKEIAMGAQKWVNLQYHSSANTCIDVLKEKGYQIIATSPHNDSCLLEDFDISKKTAFVFGVEAEGVSEYTKEHADGFLKIPMVGFTESLNISVAAVIILQEVTTKMRNSSISWQLSDDEKNSLYYEWVKKTIKNVHKIEEHYHQKLE